MYKKQSEKGQVLIIVAFGLVALLGLTAVAVDGGKAYSNRRSAQNAADSAALNAALAWVRDRDVSGAATGAAATGGYNNANSAVTVNNPPAVGCDGTIPTLNPAPSSTVTYIQVIIRNTVPTYFGRIVGINQTNDCVDAVARATGGGGSGGFGGGNGLMALKKTGVSLSFTGSGDVEVEGGIAGNAGFSSTGSGDFSVDSVVQIAGAMSQTGSGDWEIKGNLWTNGFTKTGSQDWAIGGAVFNDGSFTQTGSGDFSAAGFSVVGSYHNTGSGKVTPWPPAAATYITPPTIVDPLADILAPPPMPANPGNCQSALTFTGSTNHTIDPGCYTSISNTGSGNLTLNPGTYFITNLSNTGSGLLSLGAGNYYITGSSGFSATGSAKIAIGQADPAPPTLIYLASGPLSFTGSGNVTITNSLVYLAPAAGPVSLTGSGKLTMTPQTTGLYTGLALYMDRSNTKSVSITGSGNTTYWGTVYAPSSDVTITGSSGTLVMDSQVICSTATLTGSGNLDLLYNGNHNYQVQSPDATIELTK